MIVSNYHTRPVLTWYELTPCEQADFADISGCESGAYVRYRSTIYALYEFVRCAPAWFGAYWHGYCSLSAHTGLLVHINAFEDTVVIGYYTSIPHSA